MPIRRLFLACSLLVACGARSSAATTPPPPSTVDAAVVASAPCTVWDPAADPTIAPADVAAPPEAARRSLTGLRWCVMRPGTGNDRPSETDRVTVHYTGWTTDGQMFDSSRTRGAPATFPVNALISGWTEGLEHMTVGEVRRMWIPEGLAYAGAMTGPRGMLVFDVELIAIVGR